METVLDKIRNNNLMGKIIVHDIPEDDNTPYTWHNLMGCVYEDIKHVVNKCMIDDSLDVKQEIRYVVSAYRHVCGSSFDSHLENYHQFIIDTSIDRYNEKKLFGFDWIRYPFDYFIDKEPTPFYYKHNRE